MSLAHTGLMVALAGTRLADAEAEMLRHPAVVGLTLFGRNIDGLASLRELLESVRAVREDLVIAVDQEGGRVQRIRGEGVTRLPALHGIGQAFAADPDAAHQCARDHAMVMASELRALGIDLSFAPVVDTHNPASAVIGDRSFHRDPQIITALAGDYIGGMNAAGMIATLKHFPGHGGVAGDTHIERPVDARSLEAILTDDVVPYAALLSGQRTTVMCSHVVYQQVDEAPASFSRRWIDGILRQQLGFGGIVMSDDLGMTAASVADSLFDRACMAAEAGCDLLLVCESEPAQALVAQWQDQPANRCLAEQLRFGPTTISDDQLAAARGRLQAFFQ